MNNLQTIPSIDAFLKHVEIKNLIHQCGRELTLNALRQVLDEERQAIHNGEVLSPLKDLIDRTSLTIDSWLQPSLIPVINATGIILHTNLGRAPLSKDTLFAMQAVSSGYSNLEFDLRTGRRGKRWQHAETTLCHLTGAQGALIVNNNAGAVLLVLSALANRKKVIIANSQLIEIGGGFRVPDVMRQSGAKLVAIGTTNRVHLIDYENALREGAALVLTAHHSNFQIMGFTSEPDLSQVVQAAHHVEIPLVNDLGSGALLDTSQYGLGHEPTVQEALHAGADLVCFSGDKLLGGPQAGIILGRKDLLEKIKRHPLARALRADKLCLAGITATLHHYLKGEAAEKIPVWQMIAATKEQIHQRAISWKDRLGQGKLIEGESMVGGGSLPQETLPTFLLVLAVKNPNKFLTSLRLQPEPHVIARIENDCITLDPRTVLPDQDDELLAKILFLLN